MASDKARVKTMKTERYDVPIEYLLKDVNNNFVGDGGNDVSMIQAANVGVGIVGKVCNISHYPVLLMIKLY